jgi:hypothetical protein
VAALTGYGHDDDRRRSRAAGIDIHFVKPVDLGALQAMLARPGELRAELHGGAAAPIESVPSSATPELSEAGGCGG